MFECLHDTQLHRVLDFIRNVAAGVPLIALVHSDFYPLPAKTAHAPTANPRPLLNFSTMWKLVGAHIADKCVPLLAQMGCCPIRSLGYIATPVQQTSFMFYTITSFSHIFVLGVFVW